MQGVENGVRCMCHHDVLQSLYYVLHTLELKELNDIEVYMIAVIV